MALTVEERDQYSPDGRVKLSRIPMLAVPVFAAILAGLLLALLFHVGWYLIILAALVAGGIVAGGMWGAVRFGHCRIPKLATALGLLCGVVAYSSYFYFDMIAQVGPEVAARVDAVPSYIMFRMENDIHEDVGRPQPRAKKPAVFMNWFAFIMELALIVGIAVETGRRLAWRAYDVDTAEWFRKQETRLPVGAHDELVNALESETLDQFIENWPPTGLPQNAPACALTLEYSGSKSESPLEKPVYLSAVESPFRTGIRSIFGRSRMLLQKEITPREALRLQSLFPVFAEVVQSFHGELDAVRHAKPQYNAVETEAVATVVDIPETERTHIFKGTHLLMQNVFGGLPLLLIFAGVGIGYVATLPADIVWIVALGVVAGMMILAGILIALCCPQAAESTYSVGVLKRNVQHRIDRIVDPDMDDVFHIAMTDRANWQKVKLETATDAGFAEISESSQELRLECDAQRVVIPFRSIIKSTVERFMMPIDQKTEFWFVCVTANTADGAREYLFCDASPVWGIVNNKRRRRRAEEIQNLLQS